MITTLTGPNSYELKQKLDEIKRNFQKHFGESGIETLDAESITANELPTLTQGATLFAANRLVIIKNLSLQKQLVEQFQALMKPAIAEVHVVLVEASLDKRTSFYKLLKNETDFYEFVLLDEATVVPWVVATAKLHGGTASTSVARKLVQYVGADQNLLLNEITKLVAYDRNISNETIEALIERRPEDTIFQLLECALKGDTKYALNILHGLENAHEDPFQVANMLIWQAHIMAVVASALNLSDAEIGKTAKLNPFVVRKSRNLVSKRSKGDIVLVVDTIAELDIKLKSTSIEPWQLIKLAVTKL